MKVTKVFVVPHVHWDREWYFTCEESQVLAVRDFNEVLDHLERNPDYPSYVLDGQMAVVEEYLDTVPGARERVERLVREGRLHVGPWYTQTDEMCVGAESIVRNLLYGTSAARELGAVMRIGYLPDSFGQSGQMPAILTGFGIDRAVFWRGQSQFSGTDANQFGWRSADGSRALAAQMPLGYATGKYLQTDPEALRNRLGRLFSLMDELSPTPYGILPNGHDQMPIQTNIEDALDALREAFPGREFVLGSYDDALDAIQAYAEKNPLPEVAGELFDGKRERVHRSITSIRMDNKVANTRAENLLERRVEPLLAVSHALGLDCPRELVRQAWRLLLVNHAHDSMGGCCSDLVNAQIKGRYVEAGERARLLAHYHERYLVEAADLADEGRLGLFNMSCEPGERLVTAEVLTQGERFELVDADGRAVPYDVIGVREVDPGLIDRQIVAAGNYDPFLCATIQLRRDVPTVGYEVLGVRELPGARPQAPAPTRGAAEFETEAWGVSVRTDGTIDLLDKATGTRLERVLAVECEGNDGDEYDFSPLRDGTRLLSCDTVSCEPEVTERAHSVQVSIAYTLDLPETLDGWRGRGASGTRALGVRLDLAFDRTSPVIGVRVALDNQASDFRARLLVPTGIASSVTWSDNQFGRIERPVVDPALAVWEQEGWSERPDPIYPFLSYVALSDEGRTMAVLTGGPREYEAVGEKHDTLAITLLACVGTLGKPDLLRRPGRPSGISVDTPDAQCHGHLEMDLALVCAAAPVAEVPLASIAARWLTPVDAYQRFAYAPIHLNPPAHAVPARFSLLSQADAALTPSAIKLAEDRDVVLARFYNELDEAREVAFEGARVAARVNLAEEPVEGGADVAPHAVATFELEGSWS